MAMRASSRSTISDGFEPVVLDDPAADVALALARVAGEQAGAVVDLSDTAAEFGGVLHLGEYVGEEEHLAVAGPGHERIVRVVRMLDSEPGVLDTALAAHALQVALPALAVGRIGEHEVELAGREGIVGRNAALPVARQAPASLKEATDPLARQHLGQSWLPLPALGSRTGTGAPLFME